MLDVTATVIGIIVISVVFDALGWMNFPRRLKNSREDKKNFLENLQLAKLGDPESQCKTGHAYATGAGIKKELEEAYFWYRLAACSGKEYFEARDDTAKYLNPNQLASVDKRIDNWKPKSD